ncbi:hypothetical protein BH10PLA1_BH10PLA1_21990 [soil metagenome]
MTRLDGILNLNKPEGISSARAVSRVKILIARQAKVGHAGTLDPLATGVLLVLIGKSTRQCEALMSAPKQYEATVRFGATTETDDADTLAVPYPDAILPTREQVADVLPRFIGTMLQRPPAYSALKVGGRRACDLARDGKSFPLPERPVRIDAIELLSYKAPDARLRIDCGRGTYVRAVARDLGLALHCGGYLTQLCRTKVGDFSIESAVALDRLTPDLIRSQLNVP